MLQKLYGWSDSKLYRILADAEEMTWIHQDGDRIYLAGAKRIAESMDVTYLGKHSVKLSSDCLKSNNALKQALLKAYLHDKGSTPLSQIFIRTRTGIPERTQRHYLNRDSDVYRIANFIITTIRPEDVIGARSNGYDGAFVKDGKVILQAPNTYIIQNDGQVSFHKVKQARLINSKLRALIFLEPGETPKPKRSKLWFDSDEAFYKSQKAASKSKVERRPCYNIKVREKRSSDGLIHFRVWEQYNDTLFA